MDVKNKHKIIRILNKRPFTGDIMLDGIKPSLEDEEKVDMIEKLFNLPIKKLRKIYEKLHD